MLWVMLACIPGIAAQIWFFGYGVLIQVALAAIVALAAEGAILKLRKLPVRSRLADNSLCRPRCCSASACRRWPPVDDRHRYFLRHRHRQAAVRRPRQNPFNPAMVGYVVLLISFRYR